MVYPSRGISFVAIPPIGLAYVAAALEDAGHRIGLVDGIAQWSDKFYSATYGGRLLGINGGTTQAIAEAVPRDTEIVGISCMFMHQWPLVRDLIADIRKQMPTCTIVLGGEHATGAAELILHQSSADFVVLGEGEETVVELVNALQQKQVRFDNIAGLAIRNPDPARTRPRARIRSTPTAARPAWHLVDVEVYMRRKLFHGPSLGKSMPIMATRGCPYQCTFCTSPQMWTTTWLARDPKDVVDEMRQYYFKYGATDFQFVDLTAILKRSWILEFCDALNQAKLPGITWQLPSGTRSEAIDNDVAKRLVESGCKVMTYAPESGSTRILKQIKKKVHLPRMYKSIRAARQAGMTVECFVILGFPGETMRDVLATYWFLMQTAWLGVESTPIAAYRPTPGSEMGDHMAAQGSLTWTDEVFVDLVESAAIWGGRSYNWRWSDRTLATIRLLGYMVFFATAFAVRPWRPFRILNNMRRGIQTSKLEKSLLELRQRKAPASLGPQT